MKIWNTPIYWKHGVWKRMPIDTPNFKRVFDKMSNETRKKIFNMVENVK